jgi:hypothetical protein
MLRLRRSYAAVLVALFVVASREGVVVEPQLAIHVRVRGLDARRREAQDPANVGRRDEMPGRAQEVRAQNSP